MRFGVNVALPPTGAECEHAAVTFEKVTPTSSSRASSAVRSGDLKSEI
jgi:hypothetical protein